MKHFIWVLSVAGLVVSGCGVHPPREESTLAQHPPQPRPAAVPAAGKTPPFLIGLAKKDYTHPYFGYGHEEGFTVNGVQGGEIVLRRGQAQTFSIDSDPRHDFYFSTSDIGWGAGVISQGATGNFTYRGQVEFTPDAATPEVIYYQCQNHKAMGGRIFVLDPGDDASLESLHTRYGEPGQIGLAAQDIRPAASREDVARKLEFADSLLATLPAARIQAGDGPRAQELLGEASRLVAQARQRHGAGEHQQAMELTDTALSRLVSLARLAMTSEPVQEGQRRFQQQLQSLEQLRAIHAASAERVGQYQGSEAVVSYDAQEVDRLRNRAERLARAGRYDEATQSLQQAQTLVNAAIGRMVGGAGGRQVRRGSPREEYGYEVSRYVGYAELIPVALAEKDLASKREREFYDRIRQGQALRGEAQRLAEGGDYAGAAAGMQGALEQQVLALRVLGIQGAAESVLMAAVERQLPDRANTGDDPEARYRHSLGRYEIYAGLAPLALSESEIHRERERLFHSYVAQADAKQRAAAELAGKRKYQDAVRLMQEATGALRRAFLLAGVEQ